MKRSSRARAERPGPPRCRSRNLRIDATPGEVAAVLGAGPPKAPHEWNYLPRKPVQADSEAPPQRRPKSRAKQGGQTSG